MAKTGASSGRTTRQSKRLNPEVMEERNASPENQAKDEQEDIQKFEEAKSELEETKLENDLEDTTQLETKDAQDAQSEVGPADVKAKDQVKDEPEDVRTVEGDKPETEEERVETTSTDAQGCLEVLQKEEIQVEDAEVEEVIEVKGSAPTVSVSWESDEQPDEPTTGAKDLTRTDTTAISDAEAEKAPTTEIIIESEEEQDDEIEVIEDKGTEKAEDKDDVEMESSISVDDRCEKAEQEAESDVKEEEEDRDKEATVHGKRKAVSSINSSPPKKVKLINDGYCLYVGNLDNSKYYEEIRNSLANYFMTQSLLVQDIRLDKAKKYAFVDLASQMDLTKALTLNGQKLLDKPLKIAKAKAKEAEAAKKKKDPQEVQKSKNLRCVLVENLPSSATREDVLKVFPKATAVRFLGGTDSPGKGIAFVEFQNKEQADAARGQSGTATIRGSVLRLNVVRESAGVRKPTPDSKNNKKAEAPPSDTLFVSNLPVKVQPKQLKKIFKSAVQIRIPQSDGKSKGFAFVEFASVAHAAKALKSSKNSAIQKRPLKVQFGLKSKAEPAQVLSKTLIVLGLHEKTTADTLTEAFEGASSSRIFVDKDTGLSRKFGFVDFESTDSCRRAKEAAEDVEIDGKKVSVAFARPKHSQAPDTGERGQHRGGKNGQTPGKGKKKSKVANKN